jgi:hypothetical protein
MCKIFDARIYYYRGQTLLRTLSPLKKIKFVRAGNDEADYSLHDLSLRCEPLETEYDVYIDLLPEHGGSK